MDEKFKQEIKNQTEKLKKEIYELKKDILRMKSKREKLCAELAKLNSLVTERGLAKKKAKAKLPTPPTPGE